MEKLLDKLGAERDVISNGEIERLYLKRIDAYVFVEELGEPRIKWLLIGEITEALREKGWTNLEQFDYSDGSYGLRVGRDYEAAADTHLDCYLQAAKELL